MTKKQTVIFREFPKEINVNNVTAIITFIMFIYLEVHANDSLFELK